jgi:hypothetical protein
VVAATVTLQRSSEYPPLGRAHIFKISSVFVVFRFQVKFDEYLFWTLQKLEASKCAFIGIILQFQK